MKNLTLLTCLACLISSCSSPDKQENSIPMITIGDLWDSKDYVNLSEVAESIEYIALEKTPDCILPSENMLSVKATDDFLIVQTREKPAYLFNKAGKFLFTLSAYGQGPGEFMSADIEFDPLNQIFWILDRPQKKIMKFTKNGVFIDEYPVDEWVARIEL